MDLTTCQPSRILAVTTQATCEETMDATCPDADPVCGATYAGGVGCVDDAAGFCHESGTDAYQIDVGQTVRIDFADEVNSFVWFLAAIDGGVPLITTYDRDGAVITTSGQAFACDLSQPPLSLGRPQRPILAIEVTGVGGTGYLDSLTVNP